MGVQKPAARERRSPRIADKASRLELRLLSYAAVPALALVGAPRAEAVDFTLDYAFGNWTLTTNGGTGSATDNTPTSITLNGSSACGIFAGCPSINTDFTIAAAASGFWSFDWEWTNDDSTPGYDSGSWLLNGSPTQLADTLAPASGSVGAIGITVGDIIGFRVWSLDNAGGAGHLTIRNFSVEEPGSEVPEPSTLSLMALGAAGLLLARKRRKKSA